MYTLGLINFPIPGEPKFPLNAMFTKPANRGEEGMIAKDSFLRFGVTGIFLLYKGRGV